MKDPIERADATETFVELYDTFDDCPNIVKELHKVYDKILAIPSAEPKHGKWIPLTGMQPPELHGKHYCSECDLILHLRLNGGVYNYCPNCGAKMKIVNKD